LADSSSHWPTSGDIARVNTGDFAFVLEIPFNIFPLFMENWAYSKPLSSGNIS
jgi:hypothetical protein